MWNIKLKIFHIHFLFILTSTLLSPLVFEVVSWKFKQQSCLARWDLLFDIHIGGGPEGVFNLNVTDSGKSGIKTLDFGFGLRGSDFPLDDQEKSKIRQWKIKPNLRINELFSIMANLYCHILTQRVGLLFKQPRKVKNTFINN